VARAREGQGGGARAVADVQVTRGAARSWMWRRGGAGATGSGTDTGGREAEQGSRAGAKRRKKREGGPRGLFGICGNLKDLTIN
jgi:hypothetical protein